jgi:PhzF family phenazine biosynthesis protein
MHTIMQVDAFANAPFTGNPAAVCVLAEPAGEDWMQSIASEMNLAATAFLVPHKDGFHLRWFTPTAELDLCGHGTLASAHVLWEENYLKSDGTIHFYTQSGVLTAQHNGSWITLNFPADPVHTIVPPDGLLEALGVSASYVGHGKAYCLVEVASEEIVRQITPNFAQLKAVELRGVIVTSQASSPEYDFVSRFFAPRVGIDEDTVTGSAHCSLAPYWSQKLGRETLIGYQASKRGGLVHVQLQDDRVLLGGQAITVMKGLLV